MTGRVWKVIKVFHSFCGQSQVLSRNELIGRLENQANQLRRDVLRMIYTAGKGHPGGSFSAAEIVTALYFAVMKIDPSRPGWKGRDRFILSKGHACPIWYAALARRGYFDVSCLDTLRATGSILQGHPSMQKTPGVDASAGSLGNGLSQGLGMALASRHIGQDYNVYVVLGDGEIQEGMVWEAAMAATHLAPRNLFAVVDYNGLQNDGTVREIMSIEPLVDKWKAFGWRVREIEGNDMASVLSGFEWLIKVGGPAVIIAHTVKGRGVSYMENQVEWHGSCPNRAQYAQAMRELGGASDEACSHA